VSTRRPGRPRSDDDALLARVREVLLAEPDASTRRVQALVRARRSAVLRAIRLVRGVEDGIQPGGGSQTQTAALSGSRRGELLPGQPRTGQ
jgi:hypothetical protein